MWDFSSTRELIVAQNPQKQYADAHRRDVEFAEGDQVWLSTTNLPIPGV